MRLHSNINHLTLAICVLLCFGCTKQGSNDQMPPVLRLENPDRTLKVGFVLVDGIYNSELMAPYDIFHHTVFHDEFGMEVFTVAPEIDTIHSFEGLQLIPHYAFDSDDLPEIDILVVASAENSMGSDLENAKLIEFVREKGSKASFVISLCDGAFVLAKANLVNDRISTTFPSDINKYREMFPELTVIEDVSFVHDGPLITSAGGAKSYDAALYLCEILYGKKAAENIAKGLVIDWDINSVKYQFSAYGATQIKY